MTFLSLIGVVALSGIVVNDSLILVEFYNTRRREGTPMREALIAAGRQTVALSIAILPAYGVYLLVPAGCLAWSLGLHGMSLHRALRRVHVLLLPIRAFTLRMLPWLLAALCPLLITAMILDVVRPKNEPTPADVSVLPDALWLGLDWDVLCHCGLIGRCGALR